CRSAEAALAPHREARQAGAMIRRLLLTLLCCLVLSAPVPAAAQGRPPLALAAASLQEAMNAAADAWARTGHDRPVLSFAASSALARQVAAGAKADLFVSADEEWMDDLQRRGMIVPDTRVPFLGNRLVLVTGPALRTRVALVRGA